MFAWTRLSTWAPSFERVHLHQGRNLRACIWALLRRQLLWFLLTRGLIPQIGDCSTKDALLCFVSLVYIISTLFCLEGFTQFELGSDFVSGNDLYLEIFSDPVHLWWYQARLTTHEWIRVCRARFPDNILVHYDHFFIGLLSFIDRNHILRRKLIIYAQSGIGSELWLLNLIFECRVDFPSQATLSGRTLRLKGL